MVSLVENENESQSRLELAGTKGFVLIQSFKTD